MVDGGLSPDEVMLLDQKVNEFNHHGELPFTFTVTDIAAAIKKLAGG